MRRKGITLHQTAVLYYLEGCELKGSELRERLNRGRFWKVSRGRFYWLMMDLERRGLVEVVIDRRRYRRVDDQLLSLIDIWERKANYEDDRAVEAAGTDDERAHKLVARTRRLSAVQLKRCLGRREES